MKHVSELIPLALRDLKTRRTLEDYREDETRDLCGCGRPLENPETQECCSQCHWDRLNEDNWKELDND
jgi:hypothetical protein